MKPISEAIALFRRERGLWRYALRPMGWAALAYLAVVLLTAGVGERIGEALAGRTGGLFGAAAGLVLTVVLGGAIYLALVALISGFGFDRLSVEVEQRAFGRSVGEPVGFARGLPDGVARFLLATTLGLVGLCLSGTVVAPWLIASLLVLLDTTAPSLLRRGFGLFRQLGVLRRVPGSLSYALIAGLIVLVPVVNVLALPILVAAGTLLVAKEDPRSLGF